MLALSFPLPVQHLAQDARRFVSQATPRMMIVAAGFFSVLTLIVGLSAFYSAAPSCSAGESLLVYSRYNKKGISDGHAYSCGQPHQTCVARADGSAYDCSPFMAPRGSLTWR